jgi:hypothetical protein
METKEIDPAEQRLLAGAEQRMGSYILVLLPVGAGAAGWHWGGAMAAAFALGGGLAYLNYRWIVAVVDALVRAQKSEVPKRTYAKLFLPLVLLVVVLYVIFSRSWLSVAGVLAGLSLLVLSVLIELVYEIVVSPGG